MDVEKIIANAKEIRSRSSIVAGIEFLRVYAGENSSFFAKAKKELEEFEDSETSLSEITKILDGFIMYAQKGLLNGVSIERKAQMDVVSDFLEQAHTLLNTRGVHPAAPAVIIGAALEEFLRNWVEDSNLDLGGKKSSLDSYAKVLREADLITKQDIKDITSWAGLRNDAAHGKWDEVDDKNRISIMLESVNLFMRKYGERNA